MERKASEILFGEVNDPLVDLFCSTDLTACTHNDNVSIPNLADLIFERCTNSSWVVVFKAESTFHHLMSYGNEVSVVMFVAGYFHCSSDSTILISHLPGDV